MSDSLWPHGLYSPCKSPGQNTGVGSLSLFQGIFPTQGSNPGPPHYRWILYQPSLEGSPRILECVAVPFSSRSSQPRNELGSPTLQADSLPTELWGKFADSNWNLPITSEILFPALPLLISVPSPLAASPCTFAYNPGWGGGSILPIWEMEDANVSGLTICAGSNN